jgi:predicted nucleic acid-binding protein
MAKILNILNVGKIEEDIPDMPFITQILKIITSLFNKDKSEKQVEIIDFSSSVVLGETSEMSKTWILSSTYQLLFQQNHLKTL